MGVTTSRPAEAQRGARPDGAAAGLASPPGFRRSRASFSRRQASLGENITNTSTSGSSSTTSTSGLSAALDDFFNAFQGLAANPTDSGGAETVVEQAGVLTDRFQEIAQPEPGPDQRELPGGRRGDDGQQPLDPGRPAQQPDQRPNGAGSGAAAALIDQREGDAGDARRADADQRADQFAGRGPDLHHRHAAATPSLWSATPP